MNNPLHVLLIDDNPGDVRLIQEAIREASEEEVELALADRLSAGLKRLEDDTLDCVLLDLMLPDSQGFDTFLKIRALAPDLPVIVLTGLSDLALAAKIFREGPSDYLIKGQFYGNQLLHTIRLNIQRKQAEKALRESEERLRLTLAAAQVGTWDWDIAADRDTWGGATSELLNTPPDRFDGRLAAFLELVDARDRERIRSAVWAAIDEGAPYEVEFRVAHPAGGVRWVLSRGKVLRDSAGRPVRMLGTVQDVTDRRQAEEALRESQEQAQSIVETANEAFVGMDAAGRIIDWNRQAETTFGWTRQEAVGRTVAELLIPPSHRQAHHNGLLRFLQTGDGPILRQRIEIKALHRKGHEFPAELTVWPTQIRGEHRFFAFIHDITDRKRLEEQLFQAQKMEAVGRLAGGVAHDFNNLLTVINGYSELALLGLPPDSPLRDALELIKKSGERAAGLTHQLLAFSRKLVLAPVVLDLNAIVMEMDKMLRRLIGEDVELITALEPKLSPVKADPGQIGQVIMNLAVNARDAMPKGGTLSITTANVELDQAYVRDHPEVSAGPHVRLAVTDTGSGMDAETLARIFEPFFTTKGPGQGTGLGLSTVYGIVQQSGGSIEVSSAPGHGTTFRVYLPRAHAVQTLRSSRQGLQAAPQGIETILLVEDEEGVRTLASLILHTHGYTVLEAKDGAEALDLCRTHTGPIHLLVTDVIMPGMSGRQLAEKASEVRPGLKILYVSGHADETLSQHGILEPGVSLLQKPFTSSGLARQVREVLGG